MKKIDLHLHLSYNPIEDGKGMKVSAYQEMLPHLEKLGIEKGVLMSCGEQRTGMPFGTNEENFQIVKADPKHYACMCNLDDDGCVKTVYERLAFYQEKGAVGIGELMMNRRSG